jgi:hypothetical protein
MGIMTANATTPCYIAFADLAAAEGSRVSGAWRLASSQDSRLARAGAVVVTVTGP